MQQNISSTSHTTHSNDNNVSNAHNFDNEKLYLPIYGLRNDPNAQKHLVKKKNRGEVVKEARYRILNDLNILATTKMQGKDNRKRNSIYSSCLEAISQYYQISKRTLQRINKKYKAYGDVSCERRSGRPKKIINHVKRIIIDTRNEKGGRSIRSTANAIKSKELGTFKTKYRNKERFSPSKSSIGNVILEGKTLSIKKRPKLTPENKEIREKYAKKQMQKSFQERYENRAFIDECYLSLEHIGNGKLIEHADATPVSESQMIRNVISKRHPTKILVMAVVCLPDMLNRETAGQQGIGEKAIFSEERNGKVCLLRIIEKSCYKRSVSKIVDGKRIIIKNRGDLKWVSINLDGATYSKFLTMKDGVFDSLKNYFGSHAKIILQEDGAPGHGYNNRKRGVPTDFHNELVQNGKKRKIHVVKQPKNSPETNPLDLGIWYSLQSKIKNEMFDVQESNAINNSFVEQKMWEIAKQGWEEIESKTIWNCCLVRDEILKEMAKNGGDVIKKEPHSKIRERWGTMEDNIR